MLVRANKCDIARGGRGEGKEKFAISCILAMWHARGMYAELLTSVRPVFLMPRSATLNVALGDAT